MVTTPKSTISTKRSLEFTAHRVSPTHTSHKTQHSPARTSQSKKVNSISPVQTQKDSKNMRWLTKKEVCEYTGYEESTVNNWFKSSFAQKNNLVINRATGQPSMILLSSLEAYLHARNEEHTLSDENASHQPSTHLSPSPQKPTPPASPQHTQKKEHTELNTKDELSRTQSSLEITIQSLQTQLASYQDQLQKKDEQIHRILEQSARQISKLVESENKTKILLQNQQILQNQLQEKMNIILERTLPDAHTESKPKRKKFLGLF